MSEQMIDLSNVVFPDEMDLRTASIYLGVSEMRVRTLARTGDIIGDKDEKNRWVFHRAILDEYKNRPVTVKERKAKGPAREGKAWIIHVKYLDIPAVQEALAPFGIELEPRYNYAKQAEYRERRAAEKAAEAKTKK